MQNMSTGLHAEQENRISGEHENRISGEHENRTACRTENMISGEQDIRRTCEQEKMQNRTIRRTGKGGRTVKKDNKENKKGLRQSCC